MEIMERFFGLSQFIVICDHHVHIRKSVLLLLAGSILQVKQRTIHTLHNSIQLKCYYFSRFCSCYCIICRIRLLSAPTLLNLHPKSESQSQILAQICYLVLMMFVFCNFIVYFLSGQHILLSMKSSYSYCNYLVDQGKVRHTDMHLNQTFIKTEAVRQIEKNILSEITGKRKIIFFEGTPGVGKSTAIQYTINQILQKNEKNRKEKQILIYYHNFENKDINSTGIYQFQTHNYNAGLAKNVFNSLYGISEQQKLYILQQSFRYLSGRAKVLVIFDGVNKVKSDQKFIKYLQSFAQLFLDKSKDFHLFLCSSEQGLQTEYDKNYSFLRFKYSMLIDIDNQQQKQLEMLLQKKISVSNMSEKYRTKIREKKQQIMSLCFGFRQMNQLYKIIRQKINKLSVDQIIEQRKLFVYGAAKRKLVKKWKDYKEEICAILDGDQITEITQNLKELKNKNILFSQTQFYSKIIQVSFRENYPYCEQIGKEKKKVKRRRRRVSIDNKCVQEKS